ncbi:MAG: antitoxin [Chloroflexota bacterium]
MTKRLQVLFDDIELKKIQGLAKRRGMTTAEWVRMSLRAARESQSRKDPATRSAILRAAARHAFPTGDIDQMLGEIERGYLLPPR